MERDRKVDDRGRPGAEGRLGPHVAPSRGRWSVGAVLAVATLGLTGCVGAIGDGPTGPDEGADGPGGGPGGGDRPNEVPETRPELPPGTDPVELPEARIWRLTPTQYVRSFEAAFGPSVVDVEDIPSDPVADGYDNNAAQLFVNEQLGRLAYENAVAAGARIAGDLTAIDPCLNEATPSDGCLDTLFTKYGEPAFRRPLSTEELAAYRAVFRAVALETGKVDAVRASIEILAQSPHFLYRSEVGESQDGPETRLTHHEIASQLAYLLTDAPPDAELLAAAANEELHTRENVASHALRLLDSDAAREKVRNFFAQYLKITALQSASVAKAAAFTTFTPDLQRDLFLETVSFAEHVTFDGQGTLTELLTAPYTFMTERLATHYGEGDASSNTTLERVDLENDERRGVMAHGSVLAVRAKSDDTDPLHRGLFVYEDLLCQTVYVPENVDIFADADKLESPEENATKRDDFEFFQATAPGECVGCHSGFVPMGLAFERFDAVGKFRTTQFEKTLETDGNFGFADPDEEAAYDDSRGLMAAVAASSVAQACFVERFGTFGLGRHTKVTNQSLLASDFMAANLGIRDLLLSLTQDDVFFYRRVLEETP